MAKRLSTFIALSFVVALGFAKEKTKNTLPAYVLHAQTVAVIVDPSAQFSIEDPHANLTAQRAVEAALVKWGRFEPVSEAQTADLIVVVRKGRGRSVDETIPDSQQNNAGIIDPRGGAMGPQRGPQPGMGPNQQNGGSETGFADAEDYFAVFKGGENPLNATPVWKYLGSDGLQLETVPAVLAFKKAVAAAEKAAADKP
jgi:hypothetical protein